MASEFLLVDNIQELGMAFTFIAYLIWQRSLDRKDAEEERTLRLEEKNNFIKILEEIKLEMRFLSNQIKKK
jgi:hypothetical protein